MQNKQLPITDIRKEIDILTERPLEEWDLSDPDYNVRIIEREILKANYMENLLLRDCAAWCFGQTMGSTTQTFHSLYKASEKTSKPSDIIWFLDGNKPRHVGIWIGNELVQSKWGVGHVYEHHYASVPESYGTRVEFSRELNPDVVRNIWASTCELNKESLYKKNLK